MAMCISMAIIFERRQSDTCRINWCVTVKTSHWRTLSGEPKGNVYLSINDKGLWGLIILTSNR
jgi:hypothetical protein